MSDQLSLNQTDSPNLPVRIDDNSAALSVRVRSEALTVVDDSSWPAQAAPALNAARTAQVDEIAALKERCEEVMSQIDAEWKRARREPTDRHQIMVGLT